MKQDTKAIQAIHNHVITHNPRVKVTHSDFNTWNLHIHNVQEEDGGVYMCQVNTNPMISQVGIINCNHHFSTEKKVCVNTNTLFVHYTLVAVAKFA